MEDLSGGLEAVKIAVDVGAGKLPPEFEYVTTSVPSTFTDTDDFELQFTGCGCEPADVVSTCHRAVDEGLCDCIVRRSYGLNYDDSGHLLADDDAGVPSSRSEKPVFECNKLCPCPTSGPHKCPNRVVQRGVRIDGFVVFLTNDGRGWGLRTTTPIAKGTFVCEYAGEIIDYAQAKVRVESQRPTDDNYVYVLREHMAGGKAICSYYYDPTYVGNVGRFANHSCEPNLTVIPVRVDTVVPRLALFARRHVQPGEELCFDYSGNLANTRAAEFTDSLVLGSDERTSRRKLCLCGAATCRKYLPYDDTLFVT